MTNTTTTATISASERNALTRLVKNDFDTLLTEIEALASEAVAQARAEYEATNRAYKEKVEKAVAALNADIQKRTQKIREDAEAAGYDVRFSRDYGKDYRVELNGSPVQIQAKELLDDRLREIQTARANAENTLKRERLDIERDILVTAITSTAAQDFLGKIPRARDLFGKSLAATGTTLTLSSK